MPTSSISETFSKQEAQLSLG